MKTLRSMKSSKSHRTNKSLKKSNYKEDNPDDESASIDFGDIGDMRVTELEDEYKRATDLALKKNSETKKFVKTL